MKLVAASPEIVIAHLPSFGRQYLWVVTKLSRDGSDIEYKNDGAPYVKIAAVKPVINISPTYHMHSDQWQGSS